MALAGETLRPGVGHAGALEAHQGDHAPEEQIHFPEVGKLLQHPGADEPVVGMVIDHLGPHHGQELVEALGSGPFEEGVRLPTGADAVDHLAAVMVGIHHGVHGVDVILPVTVDGDGDVALVLGLHQSGQDSVLVAPVAALADAQVMLVLAGQVTNNVPGFVLAAVVDEEDTAVLTNFACGGQGFDLIQEHGGGDGQHLLLVIAGNDNKQSGCHRLSPLFSGLVWPQSAARIMNMGMRE